jgi:uncharacterized membrane-anchored protein
MGRKNLLGLGRKRLSILNGRSLLLVGCKSLVEETMSLLKTKALLWFFIHPLVYLIYVSLGCLGLFNYYISLNKSNFWWLISNAFYPLLFYKFYSLYIVFYHWESKMDDLFWKTIIAIVLGMLVWFFVLIHSAY